MNDFQLILTSAVVSTAISSAFSMWGQHLERKNRQLENDLARKSRMDELLLAKAVEMALDEKRTYMDMMKSQNKSGLCPPDILSVAQILRYLRHLLNNNTLPDDLKKELRSQIVQNLGKNPFNNGPWDDLLGSEDLKINTPQPPAIITPGANSPQ